jgi:hypothetical protein
MNNIGIGIMCFGADKYFEHTQMLIDAFANISTYILTDNPIKFSENKNVIKYNRQVNSYHDKIIVAKEILKFHDTCILLDADTLIKDSSILDDLLNYPFQEGITYIDNLKHLTCETIGDIQPTERWNTYFDYVKNIYTEYTNLETIHEYFLVFKSNIDDKFFATYEKLQIVKEYCDVKCNKEILGAGEGVSIQIAASITNTPIRKDDELNKIIQNKILNITQRK